MALPILDKTWQFDHVTNSLSGNETTDVNDLFLDVKTSALTFGFNPLTVAGSSNGVSANMTGTDLILLQADFVHDIAGNPHSWIVFNLNQVTPGMQFCFDFDYVKGTHVDIISSPTGFSGGDISNRPTAVDEQILTQDQSWVGLVGDDDGTGGPLQAHLLLSSDGECFRLIMTKTGSAHGFLLIEKPKRPVTGWTNPSISIFRSTIQSDGGLSPTGTLNGWSNGPISDANLSLHAIGPLGAMLLNPRMEALLFNFNPFSAVDFSAPNGISGEFYFNRTLLESATTGQLGVHGEITDLFFWGGGGSGNTFPSDGTKQFFNIDSVVFPGDGTDWNIG